jgi:hypothetical protein
MTINLVFIAGTRAIFMIRISGKEIFYNDKKQGLQMLYPKPSKIALKMGEPTKEEQEEYNMCKTEEELEAFVVRDCKIKGARLIKREIK